MGLLADRWIAVVGAGIGSGAALYYLSRPRGPPVPPPEDTDFGAYLRDLSVGLPQPAPQGGQDAYEDTSFEAYLRAGAFKAAGADQENNAGVVASGPSVAPDAVPVTIVFGTEFGFSKEVAERLAEKLKSAGKNYEPIVVDMAEHEDGLPALASQQALFVVCSTQGDGVPPAEARGFCTWLSKLGASEFDGVPFSVCALGDTAYANFCRCGRTIDGQLEALGGTRIAPRMDVNREDYTAIDSWIDAALLELGTLALRTGAELEGTPAAALWSTGGAPGRRRQEKGLGAVAALHGTVRVEFDLGDSNLTYVPGDAVGVWPSNDPKEVETVMEALGAGNPAVPVPRWHYADARLEDGAETMPLRDALSRCYDLRQPKLELFAALRAALPVGEGALGAELDGLIADREAAEAYLEPRHVSDVLAAFRPARLAPTELLAALRQLAPRLYSISSSQLEGAGQVQATVAVVRYSSLGRERVGVCSTDLCERLAVGDSVPIYVHANPDFRLPEDDGTPIVMERELRQASAGDALLFFGCRRRDQDYLYADLLEGWAAQGAIELQTAFSRHEPNKKVYVQHRLAECAERVWQLLDGRKAHFYVCGDAAAMAVDVEKALLDIVAARTGGEEAARAYLDALAAEGRYQRDVWF
ncbi:hypothetical protein QBZ16_000426 [Prototheca wickerhamii]|uniref:Uncharacterized protein n=1 Tax=Prototheca wickerhamii TaxID=3111 RepID=A0AAD9IPF0_PROWI|nr:hypothetical protein QBZ16_000426 [Prototheca wickerhamii]